MIGAIVDAELDPILNRFIKGDLANKKTRMPYNEQHSTYIDTENCLVVFNKSGV